MSWRDCGWCGWRDYVSWLLYGSCDLDPLIEEINKYAPHTTRYTEPLTFGRIFKMGLQIENTPRIFISHLFGATSVRRIQIH